MNKLIHGLTAMPLLLLLPGALAVAPAHAADDPAVNRLLASQCAQCHGTNGYATGGFEDLAGEEAKDLYEDLTDMKGEDKPENIMDHQALGYSDDQIRRIASYYAGLPENEGAGSASDEDERESKERERDEDDDD